MISEISSGLNFQDLIISRFRGYEINISDFQILKFISSLAWEWIIFSKMPLKTL